MKIKFIYPIGHKTALLFDTMIPTFVANGHEITENINDADVVFFDIYGGVGLYNEDDINLILTNKKPVIIFDDIDYGAMSANDRWIGFRMQDDKIKIEYIISCFLESCQTIYFMRKMDKTLNYPAWVFPYEMIQYPDCNFPDVTIDGLFNRPYDICFIGNTSPTRRSVMKGLKEHFKCDFLLTEDRLPHKEWISRHGQAKMFLTSDGGGFSDERPYQLITTAAMLKQKNNHLQQHPFTDYMDCLEVSEIPTENDIYNIKDILSAKNNLYHIYDQGVWQMHNYYNSEYRAKHILDVLKQNGIA